MKNILTIIAMVGVLFVLGCDRKIDLEAEKANVKAVLDSNNSSRDCCMVLIRFHGTF